MTIDLDARQVARIVRLKARFVRGRQWSWRIRMARALIALAGRIAWFEVELKTEG